MFDVKLVKGVAYLGYNVAEQNQEIYTVHRHFLASEMNHFYTPDRDI